MAIYRPQVTPDSVKVSNKQSTFNYFARKIMAIYSPPIEDDDDRTATVEDYGQNGVGDRDVAAGPAAAQNVDAKEDESNHDNQRRQSTPNAEPAKASWTEHPKLRHLMRFSQLCGDIVNNEKVSYCIIVLIVINAAMMGIATFDFVTDNPKVDDAFEKTDQAFLIVFSIELVMQFIFRGYKLFTDGWLVFDFIIILLSWSFSQLQIIRAFRIFRALRIITRIETMRNLVAALFDIMPRLGAITTLLLLIFYIFAVLFTQLFGELELSGEYFSRLDYSFLTLFVMMTMEWADVARECMDEIWWAWAPIMAFIMITGFIVFNLIIAVVCDAVAVIENKEDLEGDFFGGIVGSKSQDALGDEGMFESANGGRFSIVANGGSGRMAGTMGACEEELVDDLAERMAGVLKSQKEMLATLESLSRDSFVPAHRGAGSREEQED
mmetsp:Transcript_58413/g.123910  ORF Transcript_58413/g.123910 Transcript_58413/m.123910 type:complete len:437 (-) Transcript_58413:149-1459(-)